MINTNPFLNCGYYVSSKRDWYKAIKCDLEKSLLGFPSLAAVLITFVLCLTGSVYTNAEGRAYSVLEALLNFERGFMENNDSFCSLSILILFSN